MENNKYTRILQIVSHEDLAKVFRTSIILFGVGGVGGQALEALVRAGFKKITIVDSDVVEVTNLNRQLIATRHNIGTPKVEAAKQRMEELDAEVTIEAQFAAVTCENITDFKLETYDYIIDAIDSFGPKMALIKYALEHNLNIISAMGAGNRLDPTKVVVSDIYQTSGDPFAKKIRTELRKAGFKSLPVVYSTELPRRNNGVKPGSSPFVPAAAGLALASYIFTNVIAK